MSTASATARRFDPLAVASVSGELADQATRRLILTMVITGGIFLVYTALYLGPYYESGFALARVLGVTTILLSFGSAVYLRRLSPSRGVIEAIGVGYEILIVLVIEIMLFWRVPSFNYVQPLDTISWSCVVIVLFPFLLPMTARKVLLSSLAAATASPVAMALAIAFNDQAMPSGGVISSLLLPPYLCAVAAVAPARVLSRMGKAVSEARRLGAYELVERLGQGGMGEVWRAKHRLLARPAAIKLIRPEALGAGDPSRAQMVTERFEREAQATASLESPHTVELYDFGISKDGTFFYVMELVPGIDLEAVVERFGPLPPGRVVHLLRQACESLEEAHRAGLVHRDIKPANLLVGRRGRQLDFLRVLDFGLVKSETALTGGEQKLTAENVVSGTPSYLSPEAVTGNAPVGPRADIYALGCVAHWLLVGRTVFEGDTPVKVAFAHATKEPLPLSAWDEVSIPASLEALVMTCLAKDPDDRPRDAMDLYERLGACDDVETWSAEAAERWWRLHDPSVIQHFSGS